MSLAGKPVVAIIQARSGSQRLPNKVTLPIGGRPALFYVIERTKRSRLIDHIILATTTAPRDAALAALGEACGITVFRGSEEDVLGRFVSSLTAQTVPFEYLARVNADNFVICPEVIDLALEDLVARELDVVNPFRDHTYPFGVGAEVAPVPLLMALEKETAGRAGPYREHIFTYAYQHPDRYRTDTLSAPPEHRRPDLSVSVDTRVDYDRVRTFIESLPENQRVSFSLDDLLAYFDAHPPAPQLVVSRATPETLEKYFEQVATVFDRVDPDAIRRNMQRFDDQTRFYAFELADHYVGVLFLHPIAVGPLLLGGVGGVSLRPEQRGRRLGRQLMERVIADGEARFPALQLWTRIPDFFRRFGFRDVTAYFAEDPVGSMPMMYFYDAAETVLAQLPQPVPRDYF